MKKEKLSNDIIEFVKEENSKSISEILGDRITDFIHIDEENGNVIFDFKVTMEYDKEMMLEYINSKQ